MRSGPPVPRDSTAPKAGKGTRTNCDLPVPISPMSPASYDPGNASPLRPVTEVLVPGSWAGLGPSRRPPAGTMGTSDDHLHHPHPSDPEPGPGCGHARLGAGDRGRVAAGAAFGRRASGGRGRATIAPRARRPVDQPRDEARPPIPPLAPGDR